MNRILAVRERDNVSALRVAIREAFYDKGDTRGGNQVNAILSGLASDTMTNADRREVADELAHYASTNPANMAQLSADMVGGALGGVGAAASAGRAATEVEAAPAGRAVQAGAEAETDARLKTNSLAQASLKRYDLPSDRLQHILANHRPGSGMSGKTEFPRGWSDEDIRQAIENVAEDPSSARVMVDRDRQLIYGPQTGVRIRVIIGRDGRTVVSAYPVGLPTNP
jgi:hypothetical protein